MIHRYVLCALPALWVGLYYNTHVRALCVACAVGGADVQFTRTCSVRCLRCGWGCCTIHTYVLCALPALWVGLLYNSQVQDGKVRLQVGCCSTASWSCN